jgi:Ni,Fe-hydrogenase III large subunit
MTLHSVVREHGQRIDNHRPWPRLVIDEDCWRHAATELARGRAGLLALWTDNEAVHMGIIEDPADILVVSLPCPERRFQSVGLIHAPALRLERALRDLYGLEPEGSPDLRPWLDHNRWGLRHPLGSGEATPATGSIYEFLPSEGPPLHQIPVGPVHAGIIEPGHFRFTTNGETVVRLEERLGYVHKGIDSLMVGAPLERATKLAARVSGDSTVAYALAFARAVEAALGFEVPARAVWLRALMAELERLANHLGDIGAICNDASFSLIYAHCGALREQVLRAAEQCFGHRLMMDRVVPGGTAVDIDNKGATVLRALISTVRRNFPALVELYDNTASLQNRTVSTGALKTELARQYRAGGYIGRASGRTFDARRTPGYPPYYDLKFDIPIRQEGDVDARVWIRIREIDASLFIIEEILHRLPTGAIRQEAVASAVGNGMREGIALTEGFRGDILAWVRTGVDGTIMRCHLRDPSWFQWPLLEAAIEGNIVADFPLCNKSFNCSYSGHDL